MPLKCKELTTIERKLINAITAGSLDQVVQLMTTEDEKININVCDEHGMSLLQHACYQGNLPIASYLLERGADVNQNDHESGYTALMFAALGGHLPVISLLLEHGADVEAKNSVNRNASQMAAFVGQHRSVAVINNFLPREFIEYYSQITGLEKEPRLPARLIIPVANFVRLVNINPLRVIYFLRANATTFFEERDRLAKVLELLSERLFKQPEPLEMFSLKVHYLNFIYEKVTTFLDKIRKNPKLETSENANKFDLDKALNSLMKSWLRCNENNFPELMERLMRESIRTYSYQENTLFQQLVRTLSTIEIGQEPTCLSILSQAFLGKAMDGEEGTVCFTCHEASPDKRCSHCKVSVYCNQQCQRLHWPLHKMFCEKLRLTRIEQEKLKEEEEKRKTIQEKLEKHINDESKTNKCTNLDDENDENNYSDSIVIQDNREDKSNKRQDEIDKNGDEHVNDSSSTVASYSASQ